jgi:hypothetical protein
MFTNIQQQTLPAGMSNAPSPSSCLTTNPWVDVYSVAGTPCRHVQRLLRLFLAAATAATDGPAERGVPKQHTAAEARCPEQWAFGAEQGTGRLFFFMREGGDLREGFLSSRPLMLNNCQDGVATSWVRKTSLSIILQSTGWLAIRGLGGGGAELGTLNGRHLLQ